MNAISQANEVKGRLLSSFPAQIKAATIVLGDDGFRVELEINLPYKFQWHPPQEMDGVRITWF